MTEDEKRAIGVLFAFLAIIVVSIANFDPIVSLIAYIVESL